MADADKLAPKARGPWPDLTEYHEAVQHPLRAFSDAGLKAATIESDRFGMPKPATGGNAVVYKAIEKGEAWAVRCFLRPISDHAERYEAISKHLGKVRLPYSVPFLFLRDGIQVRGGWYPTIKMKWAAGDLLHNFIEKNLKQPKALAGLRQRWQGLARDLERAKIAHGDLQHGNVLVRNGDLTLIDYDGMWVPSLSGRAATELGHRAYQHPKRKDSDFGAYIDRFSALVIYVSIAALEAEPGLWAEYHTGDNLIFVRDDFRSAGRTAVWQSLGQVRTDEMKHLAGVLATCVEHRPSDVPDLESVVRRSTRVKPKALPTAPQKQKGAPSGLPSWLSSGALSALAVVDLAPQWKMTWSRPGERIERRWKKGAAPAPAAKEAAPRPVRRPSAAGRALLAIVGLLVGGAMAFRVSIPAGASVALGAWILVGILSLRSRAPKDDDDEDDESDAHLREEVRTTVPGMASKVTSIQVAPNGKLVAVVTQNGENGIWEIASDAFRASRARLPSFQMSALALGMPLAVVAKDQEASVWNIVQWLRTECPVDPSSKLYSVAISADGTRVALGYGRSVVTLVDVPRKRVIGELRLQGGPVTALAISNDAEVILTGATTGAVQLARMHPRPEKVADGFIHTASITALAAGHKGRLLASGDSHGVVSLWSPEMRLLFSIPLARVPITSLCLMGERDFALAVGSSDGTIKVLSAGSGRPVASFQVGTSAVTALAYARTKPGLAAGTADGRVAFFAAS